MEKLRDINKMVEMVHDANRIFISTHKSPDGDAIGSSLALKQGLEKLGKTVTVVVPDAFPAFLNWMVNKGDLLQFDQQSEEVKLALQEAELVFSLDYNTLSRVGKDLEQLLRTDETPKLIIDHHREPEDAAFVAGLHDIEASSTAQLVYDFIQAFDEAGLIDKRTAACIYAGIVTDTGSFRFRSTTAKTHRVVADLMDLGLVTGEVYNEIFDTNSLDRIKLLGYVLDKKLTVFPELELAHISLSEKELNQFNYKSGDTEGVVNYPLSIKGVNVSCIMKENGGIIRMSFRSKGDIDVNLFARKYFNGGGHLNAAGGMSELSLEETVTKFEAAAKEYFGA
ncbi:bifunctional oligoribonuclease/PAP phosphatase NrnA [Salibacteraceae bacterium]|nr:bifunctional oligoribonuclease/PAP phosphatase NrnA [Salibacteraceae bacterium]MDB0057932.1 bifunctional oligoribonuclease/PAP phosphatase NrnA [Salibacteraceae bacterium]MDC1205123.1 bifunctional oligoribonuclease/PAP phosphatase NrnA [Salibacteraceae bacterium]